MGWAIVLVGEYQYANVILNLDRLFHLPFLTSW